MDIRKYIKKAIGKIEARNASRTKGYKKKLKEQIRVNLLEKKESVDSNKGLIRRYYNAKPQPLTQMQQALMEAAQ